MSIPQSVASILRDHVTLEVESIDRMHLNAYVPRLQYASGVVGFFRQLRGQPIASSALMSPLTRDFVSSIARCAKTHSVPLLTFENGQDQEDIAAQYRAQFTRPDGVVVFRPPRERLSLSHSGRQSRWTRKGRLSQTHRG